MPGHLYQHHQDRQDPPAESNDLNNLLRNVNLPDTSIRALPHVPPELTIRPMSPQNNLPELSITPMTNRTSSITGTSNPPVVSVQRSAGQTNRDFPNPVRNRETAVGTIQRNVRSSNQTLPNPARQNSDLPPSLPSLPRLPTLPSNRERVVGSVQRNVRSSNETLPNPARQNSDLPPSLPSLPSVPTLPSLPSLPTLPSNRETAIGSVQRNVSSSNQAFPNPATPNFSRPTNLNALLDWPSFPNNRETAAEVGSVQRNVRPSNQTFPNPARQNSGLPPSLPNLPNLPTLPSMPNFPFQNAAMRNQQNQPHPNPALEHYRNLLDSLNQSNPDSRQ